jgi:hypothetical protein
LLFGISELNMLIVIALVGNQVIPVSAASDLQEFWGIFKTEVLNYAKHSENLIWVYFHRQFRG